MDAVLAERPEECSQVEVWLHLYLDGECGPEERSLVEAHLASCEACGMHFSLLEKTRAGLRQAADREARTPPVAFQRRLEADLARAARPPARRLAVAGALIAALVVTGGALALTFLTGGDAERTAAELDPVVVDVVARHTLDVPVDVASPDAARVEAFLRPRVGEPVHVPRLERVGLGLRGGRVVNVQGSDAALLVYHSGLGGRVSVVAIPDHDGRLTRRLLPKGQESTWQGRAGAFVLGARRVGPTLYTVVGQVPQETVQAVTLSLQP